MENRNCVILTQYRETGEYNDFIGKYYHFPGNSKKNYLNEFTSLPIEFIYYEPTKNGGKGEFYGYGKIIKLPFQDKREIDHYFVEISDYKPFSRPVYYKNAAGNKLEEIYSPTYYNSQNAVRKTTPNFIDEVCLDGGILLNFRADSHLIQILGEQLIASERVGILELIKNGFDAGASYCKVRIENVPNLEKIPLNLYHFNEFEGPVIIIEDDGKGMTKDDIENGWLRPASTIKTDLKIRIKKEREASKVSGRKDSFEKFLKVLKKEHNGRIPLGEKGVGRFACHRLGRKLLIKTKVAENNYEYILKINWDDFDFISGESKNLSDIGISLTRQELSRDYGNNNCGTQIIIYGGREGFELDEKEINEIGNTILKLNTPNPNPSAQHTKFHAEFECPQVKNIRDEIDYSSYDPVFTIKGEIDENGLFNYDYFFKPPYNDKIPLSPDAKKGKIVDLRTVEKEEWIEEQDGKRIWRTPQCGAFYFHVDIWYRDLPWRENLGEDFLKYLSKYGGISVFRDGINVFTAEWGNEVDWLGLRQRQIKQAKRLSYYHMIGNIEIEQGENIFLMDKTNREGMIGNRASKDLQLLVRGIVFLIENDYIGKRDELKKLTGGIIGEPATLRKFSSASSKVLSNIHENYDLVKDPYELLKELGDSSERKGKLIELSRSLNNLEENLSRIQEVQYMLTEQAGFGLGIAVALHEISKTTSNFYYGILDVLEQGKLDTVKLEDLKETSKMLESEIMRLSPLRALRNEDDLKFPVSKSIEYVTSVFKSRFEKLNIKFSYNDDDFEILTRFGSLNQIITNLLDNSCYWLDNPKIQDKRIEVKISSKDRTIIVADSGPGISDSILPYLFQPGYSLKFPPSGIGLYVCKYYMNMMKKRGDIYIAHDRDRIFDLPGAQFLLDFSKVIGE